MRIPLSKADNVYQLLYIYENSKNKIDQHNLLLEGFIEESILNNDYSFSTGFLGIGWLITYLQYNNVLDINVDEVLYDFDDNIYKIAVNKITNNESSIDELIDLITYFHQRLQTSSCTYNFYRRFSLNECLKLLINKVLILVRCKETELSNSQLSKVVLKLSYLIATHFNEREIEEEFYRNMENLLFYYNKNQDNLLEKDIEPLYYLLFSAKQYNNSYWITSLQCILNKINKERIEWLEQFSNRFLSNEISLSSLNFLDIKNQDYFFFFLASNLKIVKI